jgi:NDP-sugar pyrophosphorylase family protein
MNGDSFLDVSFGDLIRFHFSHSGLASMAVVKVPNASRYGTVVVDACNRIVEFREKTGIASPGWINAGVYIFNRELLSLVPDYPLSFEREVFPRILDRGVYAFASQGIFIDIGAPEDYSRAQAICDQLEHAASKKKARESNEQS